VLPLSDVGNGGVPCEAASDKENARRIFYLESP
jgi:hypothetical protein